MKISKTVSTIGLYYPTDLLSRGRYLDACRLFRSSNAETSTAISAEDTFVDLCQLGMLCKDAPIHASWSRLGSNFTCVPALVLEKTSRTMSSARRARFQPVHRTELKASIAI